LRELAGRMKTISKNTFKRKYGNLLGLLKVEVQAATLTTLAQYYDPPLGCFTFQDFHLVPTIEEFEHILGLSMKGKVPYRYSDQTYLNCYVSRDLLKVNLAELECKMITRGNSKGISQGYLEWRLRQIEMPFELPLVIILPSSSAGCTFKILANVTIEIYWSEYL